METMRASRAWLLLIVLGLSMAGCGDAKENAAVQRIQNRPKPGAVRLVNLSDKPATLWHKNRILNREVLPNTPGRLNPVGVGKQIVDLEIDGKKQPIELDLQSGLGDTVILLANGKTIVVRGDPQYPELGNNVFVAFVAPSGRVTMGKSSLVSSGKDIEMSASHEQMSLPVGSVSSRDGAATIAVQPNYAYSFIFVKQGNAWKPVLLLNSDDRQPVSAGASAS